MSTSLQCLAVFYPDPATTATAGRELEFESHSFNETACFARTGVSLQGDNISSTVTYENYPGWGCVAGELALRYPHLVQMNLGKMVMISRFACCPSR